MRTYLDSAYRRFLLGKYTKQGFSDFRMYVDWNGNSYVATPCWYCGDAATTEDHTIPLIFLRGLIEANEEPPREKLILVPACHECNVSLGAKMFPSMASRKAYIKKQIRKRYRSLLALPVWHVDELAELDDTLRSAVLQGIALQRKIQARLAW